MELETYTQEEANLLAPVGTLILPIRYFIYVNIEGNEYPIDVEVNEEEFLSVEGEIEYERFTVSQNGVAQVVLTKRNDLL